ncbi:putative ABC transport system permease protein [Nocardioides exalbidus]|uniref:Putative ABC transport system permease protein n=1 Tax=Nocardioides exalbidus TaxID=402596 RepID=A0A1H4WHL9_9ACTN|nr:FtsX-like permease family protein [Nocardioides exalbidus]SEC92816.1 putative ABC transport system permease protein [Nocardioides exalbidus]
MSEEAAGALGLRAGDRVLAKDQQGRQVLVRITGTFAAADPDDEIWQVAPRVLHPVSGTAEGVPYTSAAALVSTASLPDLRYALPGDAVTHRVVFSPDASRVRWRRAASLEQSVVSLQSSAALAQGEITWDSLLPSVLQDARAQIASAQGQARVLLLGLLSAALLVLVLAAQLLVRRRSDALSTARQRGATLAGVAAELAVESILVAALGGLVGLGLTRLLAGTVGWGWSVPVLVVAAVAAPVLGARAASRGTRRVAANRSARRTAERALRVRRLALEVAVLAAAALSFVALRQRGVVGGDAATGDLTATSATTWGAVAGSLVLLRVLPLLLRGALRVTRRSSGGVAFFVAARLTVTGTRVVPVMLTVVAVAQLTFAVALAATEREGQATGSLSAVGGDARLDGPPDPVLDEVAREVGGSAGVRATAVGRVADDVRVSARGGADVVRLVVVNATDYERLLTSSELADAPQLARLRSDDTDRVPALLLGGGDGLRDEPNLRWEDATVPLEVVGTAPDVDGSLDPVLVVDSGALAAAGVVAPPTTVWAVGPGATDALEGAGRRVGEAYSLTTYRDELAERRDAALPSAMLDLSTATSLLLLALAGLGTVLAAATDAPSRAESVARLRALGLPGDALRRVLVGEVVLPVVVAGVTGLALGVGGAYAALGSLSLERLTGSPGPPAPTVPWWAALAVLVLAVCSLVVAGVEWRRARRTALARLLRT